jgi:hypothetical protein
MNLKLWVGRPFAPVPPEFWPSFRFDRVWDSWGFGAGVRYQLMLRSRSLVRALLIRDLNDELLRYPYDDGRRRLAGGFAH